MNPNVLILDTIELLPAHRGRRELASFAAWHFIELFDTGCGFVACEPFPMQYGLVGEDAEWRARMGCRRVRRRQGDGAREARRVLEPARLPCHPGHEAARDEGTWRCSARPSATPSSTADPHPSDRTGTICVTRTLQFKGLGEVLCLVHNVARAKLHDAHRVVRFPVVGDDQSGDPQIAGCRARAGRRTPAVLGGGHAGLSGRVFRRLGGPAATVPGAAEFVCAPDEEWERGEQGEFGGAERGGPEEALERRRVDECSGEDEFQRRCPRAASGC